MTILFHAPASLAATALALVVLTGGVAAGAETIGKATSIATEVTALLDTSKITLKTGDEVFAKQTVSTDANGVGQFEFRDRTKLAIGPGSTVVLDDFVYNSKASASKVVIGLTRGSFRFITGGSNHDAYDIVTPTATIGVRGTAFDVYVDDRGEMAVAMINGAVEVCPRSAACRLHDIVGRFLVMTRDGLFSLHDTWDGTFLRDIPFRQALPFLNNQRLLIPALRGQTKIVGLYAASATTAIGGVVKDLPKALPKITAPKLPTLKLPKLFP
jgi:hypothetical protein